MKISVLTPGNNPLIKQFPAGKPVWGNCKFYFNEGYADCDCLFVIDSLPFDLEANCGKSNTFLSICEPPYVKLYHPEYISQFGNLISFRNFSYFKGNFINSFPLLPWLAGSKFIESKHCWNETNYIGYDELVKLTSKDKYDKIAIITSNKSFTGGHRKRLNFLTILKNALPDIIDIFGEGFQFVEDKFDIYSRYKYVIAFENCKYSGYWTEKIVDAFLCNCLPIYYGDPDIVKYFDERSFIPLDIHRPNLVAQQIRKMIDEDLYAKRVKSINKAKLQVMNDYNMFHIMAMYAEKFQKKDNNSVVSLKMEHTDNLHRLKQLIYRIGF